MQLIYRVVEAANVELLEDMINLMMSKDWKPIGGVNVDNGRFFQAMIKSKG